MHMKITRFAFPPGGVGIPDGSSVSCEPKAGFWLRAWNAKSPKPQDAFCSIARRVNVDAIDIFFSLINVAKFIAAHDGLSITGPNNDLATVRICHFFS